MGSWTFSLAFRAVGARVRVALVVDWDSGPPGDAGLREIIAGWEWTAQSSILKGLRKVRFALCANADDRERGC